jgi:hypothetical protein
MEIEIVPETKKNTNNNNTTSSIPNRTTHLREKQYNAFQPTKNKTGKNLKQERSAPAPASIHTTTTATTTTSRKTTTAFFRSFLYCVTS